MIKPAKNRMHDVTMLELELKAAEPRSSSAGRRDRRGI